jgi:transglutaminase-like putative cysteine protease
MPMPRKPEFDRAGYRAARKPHGKRTSYALPIAAFLVAVAVLLPACGGLIKDALDLSVEKPTSDDTLTDPVTYVGALEDATMTGEDTITLNITASEDDLKNLANDVDPFWGAPVSYLVNKEWDDIKLTETGPAIDVKTVEFTIKQSVSYYAYSEYTSGGAAEPPSDIADNVEAVSKAIPGVVADIEKSLEDTDEEDYDKALAVHDWLVENVEYDAGMYEGSEDNSVTGALIGRSTMCQGYAEAFELLMRCVSDADVKIEVGAGKSSENTEWADHAWNLVNLDGEWYQVDATFDDPVNSDRQEPSHIYFGRSDDGMTPDHKWNTEYWPVAKGNDFLYYRTEGLYVESKKKFRSVVKKLLKKGRPEEIELAVDGVELSEGDLQFIYDSKDAVSNILYSYTDSGDVTIVSLKLEY